MRATQFNAEPLFKNLEIAIGPSSLDDEAVDKLTEAVRGVFRKQDHK